MTKTLKKFMMGCALAGTLALCGSAFAQTAAKTTKAATAKAAPAAAPSASDIAAATSRGDVWVNLNTGVYHKAGDSNYGTTKKGKFMSEADAQKGNYHAAKSSPVGKKSTAKAAKSTAKM